MRNGSHSRAWLAATLSIVLIGSAASLAAPAEPVVTDVEAQPLAAQVARVVEALKQAGAPLDKARVRALDAAVADPSKAAASVQDALDPLCLAVVSINPESRVKVAEGPAEKTLFQHGWHVFLVKVVNEAGVTSPLHFSSPNAAPVYKVSSNSPDPAPSIKAEQVPDPLARPRRAETAATERKTIGPAPRVPDRPALQPRRGQAGGEARVRRRAGDAGPGLPQRSRTCCSTAARP